METLVIDAKGSVLGRLASFAAKQALLGKTIAIVNCDDSSIIGNPRTTINDYKQAVARGGSALKGPFISRRHSERLVKRTIRGMLSHKQGRGNDAFKRIKCYPGVPKEFESSKKTTLVRNIMHKRISMSELVKEI